jgi:hypothetical protein
MKAVLRSLSSLDVPDLESYEPKEHENFGFGLDASFGSEDSIGGDLFSITVCTPRWLEPIIRESGGIMMGRHFLLVDYYDFRRIKRFIEEYAAKCEGKTWDEVAEKLARLGHWEFEDYDDLPRGNGHSASGPRRKHRSNGPQYSRRKLGLYTVLFAFTNFIGCALLSIWIDPRFMILGFALSLAAGAFALTIRCPHCAQPMYAACKTVRRRIYFLGWMADAAPLRLVQRETAVGE